MSDQRWQKVEDIFHGAVELAPEARAAFLDQACGGDPSIRREVESLLANESENGSTFAHPAEDGAPQTIAHYRVTAKLGQGGMGAVYRAMDTKLGREVAIKILPPFFADDPDRLARFTREAKVLASLNHPNIAQIYGIEESNGVRALVMELVTGETLAAEIKRGPLPLETALAYAKQIAEAFEAAHEKGIIHRDLKPANVMVTSDGVVKVLDFGLAAVALSSSSDADPMNSPTLTMRATQVGTIMGTAAYMSPEQASGKSVDRRADIWSFGVVLFEMLTGRRLFGGETVSHTLADVLRGPIDFTRLPLKTPGKIRDLLKWCLERNVKNRLRDIGDARIVIEQALTGTPQDAVSVIASPRHSLLSWTVAVIASLIAGGFAFAFFTRKAPEAAAARFSFSPPFQATAIDVTASPDGKRIVFAHSNNRSSLWLRSVDSFDAEQLPGTEGAVRPFWSPDGRSLGFFSNGRLKTVQAGNRQSPVQTLSSAIYELSGGAWSPEGILYSPQATGIGLYRIPANGGASVPITTLNAARNELSHRYPQFLPDGRHFIYWVWSASDENTGIYAGSLDPKEKLPEGPVVRTWREARYAEPGYLLFLQGSKLVAQPFDAIRLRLTGEPLSLPETVGMHWANTGRAMFSVSSTSVLAYQQALPQPGARLVSRDRTGRQIRSVEAPQGSTSFSLAPDDKRVAVTVEDENTLEDLWVVDLDRAAPLRLTAIHGSNQYPVWSPDGRRIAFRSNRTGVYDLYAKLADGVSEEEILVKSVHTKYAASWSSDGHFLIYGEEEPKTGYDLWVLPIEGDRKPFPFLKTEFDESNGTLSPVVDSQGHRWMAYTSNETGRREIYLRPFLPGAPGGPAGSKVRVSTGGGMSAEWRGDGRELFYVADNKLMAVSVKLDGTPEIGTPQALFELHAGLYKPFSDGRRFLFLEPADEGPTPKINVVLNWTAELKR